MARLLLMLECFGLSVLERDVVHLAVSLGLSWVVETVETEVSQQGFC